MFTLLNVLYSIYFAGSHPNSRIWDFRLELFNEWAIQILCFHLMCFTDMVNMDTEPFINYKLGQSFKFLATFMIFVNLFGITVGMIRPVKHYMRKEKFRKLVPALIEQRMRERDEITRRANEELEGKINVILTNYKKNQMMTPDPAQHVSIETKTLNEEQKKSIDFKKQFYLDMQARIRKQELAKMRNLEEETDKVRRKVIRDRKMEKEQVDHENLYSSSSDDDDVLKQVKPKLQHIFKHKFFSGKKATESRMDTINEQRFEDTVVSDGG